MDHNAKCEKQNESSEEVSEVENAFVTLGLAKTSYTEQKAQKRGKTDKLD